MKIENIIKRKNWWKGYNRYLWEVPEEETPGAVGRLKAIFEKEKIPYRTIPHTEVFTSPELAASIHASGRQVAKVVMVASNRKTYMAVLPAHLKLDLKRFADLAGEKRVTLMSEKNFGRLFPDCEVGAEPPFGNLYGVPVFVDEHLAHEYEIYFQAGSHREVMAIRFEDFDRIVHPVKGRLTVETPRVVVH